MINIKTPEEIEIMRIGGGISAGALKEAFLHVKAGVTTKAIDSVVEEYILSHGATPGFKTVENYPYATCINVNAGIVHGVPNKYVLKRGDIVSIDLGALYKGFHTDLSYTIEVETDNEAKFLNAGKHALEKAIMMCRVGNRIGDISSTIQTLVEGQGYTVSELLVGHGVGRELHEDPYVPCLGVSGTGPHIKAGMVLAVEVIYQKGKPDIMLEPDGWTYSTSDGSLSALFEKTVAIEKSGFSVLTDY